MDVTLNRLESAMQVGDQASVALQNASLDTWLTLSSSSLAAAGNDLNTLAHDIAGMNLPSITLNEITNFVTGVENAQVMQNNGLLGLPQQEQALFNLFGLSSTDQQNIVNDLLGTSELSVPTSVVSALQQSAAALLGMASVYGGTSPVFPFTGDALSQVEMVYIAYFGRAGDPNGKNFWVNELTAGGDTVIPGLTGVAAAFSQQPEAMAQYPLLANPGSASQADVQVFINAIYQNLFRHTADANGLAFWTNEVNAIIATGDPLQIANGIGQMAISIALGAQGTDQTVLANKVTAADFLTQTFSEDGINTFPNPSNQFTFAHTNIAFVGAGTPSVTEAESTATGFLAANPASVIAAETAATGFVVGATSGHASAATNGSDPKWLV
jgi:hypothetical protein